MRLFCLSLILIISGFCQVTSAQSEINGYVYDAENKESLPAATVQIEGTYRGTITNNDGKFSIKIDEYPVTLLARFIGYEITKITLQRAPEEPVSFLMKPTPVSLEEIEVTGEDPGMYIMRQVIKAKKEWQETLESYKADAYTRQILRNDTGIVSITESISEAWWDAKKGASEVIKSKRQTKNVESDQNWAGASYIPNMYDNDIEISGFEMVGVTHPDALDFYNFTLQNTRKLGDTYVFDIKAEPRRKLQPTFEGMVSVLDNEFAILDVNLKPSKSMIFPPPIQEFNLNYKQQFSNFGKDYWLPVDVRIDGNIKIGFVGFQFPDINFHQISRITDYEVNVPVPDSLFSEERGERLMVDSASVKSAVDSLFIQAPSVVPLEKDEELAYAQLDSTKSLEDAFRPKGALASMAMDDDDDGGLAQYGAVFRYLKPQLWYDRVDGLSAGGNLEYKFEWGDNWREEIEFTPGIHLTYKTVSERIGYGAYAKGEFRKQGFEYDLRFMDESETRFESVNYARWMSSLAAGFGIADYFDYYWAKSFSANISKEFDTDWKELLVSAGWKWSEDRSTPQRTNYDLLARTTFRPNPEIDEGTDQRFSLGINIGDEPVPLSPIGRNRLAVNLTYSDEALGSYFSYFKTEAVMEMRLETFLKRRLLPNALDIKLQAAHISGDLPLQRLPVIEGTLMGFSPFGNLKTLRNRVYEGQTTVAGFWEHNFRTVPFELIGLESVAKQGTGIIIFGGHARTWLPDELKKRFSDAFYPYENYIERVHHEVGVSINSLFGIMRVDFAKRLDAPGFYAGISIARIL